MSSDGADADFGAMLRALHDEAQARLTARTADVASVRAARGDPAGADDEHDPEGATLSDEWSRLERLRLSVQREIDEIGAARERLRAGEYGVCASCGRRIPAERMRARPTATLCVPCAERRR